MRLSPYALCAAALVAVPVSAEDLTIVSKVTRDAGTPVTTTGYITSDKVRIAQPEGQEIIMDLKTAQTTILDARQKTYFVVTRQDMEQVKAKIKDHMNSPEMQRAQEQMKNLPPEFQKQMQAAMGGLVGSVNVAKTGTTRKIAGYTCENWTISMGQLSKTEQCVSADLPIPVPTWDAYRDYAEGFKTMTAAGPMGKSLAEMAEKLKQIKGFPLAVTTTTNVMGRTSTQSSEVVEVKKGPVPASAWEIPAGYRKIENPMSAGLKGR